MATVHIPAALRTLTGGAAEVVVPGETLGEVIDRLEVLHPGLKARLVEGDRVRPSMATFVDGTNVTPYLSTRLNEDADIYFTPAIAGGEAGERGEESVGRRATFQIAIHAQPDRDKGER